MSKKQDELSNNWLPFENAKDYARSLNLNSVKEWAAWCKSGNKPENIPAGASRVYKNNGWNSWADFLGTKKRRKGWPTYQEAKKIIASIGLRSYSGWRTLQKEGKLPKNIPTNPAAVYRDNGWTGFSEFLGTTLTYLPFEQAREIVHSLKLNNEKEWRKYCKSGDKPDNIPAVPAHVYKNKGWKGVGDWLGTGYISNRKRKYQAFEAARKIVQSLNLRNVNEWKEFKNSGKLRNDIPCSPNGVYKNSGWNGWDDFLGTSKEAQKWLPFEEARGFVRSLQLKNQVEWNNYAKSGKKPNNIPYKPQRVYRDKWLNLGDWLGTDYVAPRYRTYLTLEQAKEIVRSLKLKSKNEWSQYSKSGNLKKDIPSGPRQVYKNKGWKGWGDFLGTGNIAPQEKHYRKFEEARTFIQTQGLKSVDDWYRYCQSGKKPADIPSAPEYIYKKQGWKGMPDFLGAGRKTGGWLAFDEARKITRGLGLKSNVEWEQHYKPTDNLRNIPKYPDGYYKGKGWISWPDFLGYEVTEWNVKKVKDLLRSLIESKIIYTWNEAVLYSFLLRKGLLNLQNRHENFFKGLIEARNSARGRTLIEEYAYSKSINPPELVSTTQPLSDISNEIETASTAELQNIVEPSNPLEYEGNFTVEQVLTQTDVLESINVDEEAMQFYLDYSIDELWRCAFISEKETVTKIKLAGKNGNKYHDAVIESFLKGYAESIRLRIPSGYSFPHTPTLMQRYVAYKVSTLPYFGNFSGTGAGKTLSAILASRTIDSKLTVIVCPNDVVEQWKINILDTFPNSKVTTGREAFHVGDLEKGYRYVVLNYDKFSQEDSPNLLLTLSKHKVDFVILDEIHFTKIRKEDEVSQRRKNLDGLMTSIRKMNSDVKVLGLSATPVVNNLREGRSLLELISGKIYDDVSVRPTIPNAVTLYEKLSTMSIRELPNYSADVDTHNIEVIAQRPHGISVRQLKSNPLAIEKFLTDARIPEIIKLIDGQTVIYTEYVEDIIQNLSTAVNNAGYTHALYTGFDRSGLSRFLNKKVQVLIASRPLSVGVDGLQHICNRLIINTLPWTNAQYQQLIGRLVRKGQIRDVVHVYLVKASIGGYQYDDLKWKRIQFKRTLADCAVDGRLPEKNLVTPQQAAMEAVKWLERLERGEISTVVRRDLNVELTPVEIKKRVIKYGDFTRLNNKINSENSDTTHTRILKDPREWDEYHRQYREARKTWPIIPFEEIIKRISQLSPRLLIGDFGCGEAKILEKFGDKRVYSFDHVAINDNVTACDIKSVPLPDEAIDIAVFSLSLMGRNWPDYVKEAKRCLATNGYLLIAETTKSMKGRLSKIKQVIQQHGFDIYNEEEKGDFTFIEAREL